MVFWGGVGGEKQGLWKGCSSPFVSQCPVTLCLTHIAVTGLNKRAKKILSPILSAQEKQPPLHFYSQANCMFLINKQWHSNSKNMKDVLDQINVNPHSFKTASCDLYLNSESFPPLLLWFLQNWMTGSKLILLSTSLGGRGQDTDIRHYIANVSTFSKQFNWITLRVFFSASKMQMYSIGCKL